MGGHAWVTLATNDSYSLGALVLAHSLKQVGTQQQLAVLITPGVTGPMRSKLSEVFNVVVEVNLLDSKDETNLRLLKRPELGVTFTKLHCWRLTQFDKCVFLDADTLVLENCDELFDRDELSAAPDIGWPDCFNSGVFVFRPLMETYEKLIQFALEKGSFDGGDQGLLNLYFSDWAHKDIGKHLPFIYNMASTACYSYLPAFKQFGKSAKIIHFIGASKPWLQYFDTETRLVHPAEGLKHMQEIFQLWWNIFCNFIHPGLSPQMTSHTDTVHGSQSSTYQNPSFTLQSPDTSYPAEDYQKVWDPWEEYDSRQQSSYSHNQNIHETSSPYGYQIPETNISDHQNTQYQSTEHHHYQSQHAEHHHVQNHPNVQHNIQSNQNEHHNIQTHPAEHHNIQTHPAEHHNIQTHPAEHHNIQTHSAEHHNIQSDSAGDNNIRSHLSEHHNIQSHPAKYHNIQSRPTEHHNFQNHSAEYNDIQSHSAEHHNIESNQYFQQNNSEYNAAQSHGIQHQDEHIESHNTSACIEAHNHDHPNPVHSQLQTPVTIPIQQHLFSSNQPPPNDPPIPNLPDECMATTTVSNEMTLQNDSKEDSNENNAGIAGAFAKLTLGSPRTAEQQALDDHLRRQGWEVGNIDYMGRDSFQNIWNKICETLSSPPEQPTTIKETSPPKAESKPVEDLPLEVKSDERSVEVASSEVRPIKEVIEAEPVEKPTTGIPQECQVSQTTVTPAAETSQSLSSDEIAVSEKIVEAEISTTADKGDSKTEAQATEPSVDEAQKSEAAPVQSQIATPTSVAQTQDVVTPEVGSQPVTETPTLKAPETPATSVPEISPAQAQETPVAAVTESATAKAPAATVPEPSSTKAPETSVVTVPEASLAKAPVATVPEASPAQAPVVTVPEASLEKVPETPVKSVDEPTKLPESPISPAESSKPFPVQPPPSPADPQLVTPVISAGDSSKAQPTLEQQPAKDSPTSVLDKSAGGDSTTPVAKATQPEPKQDSSTKKPSGKLNVAVAKASSAPAPKPQAEATAPSPPTTPLSPQPQQVRVAKEASKVESTVPTTPPLDTQQTSSGPTPPPRKSSGGTKKATKAKK